MLLCLVHVTGRPQYQSNGNSEQQKQSVDIVVSERHREEVVDEVLAQAFAAFYFTAKEEISNVKVLPLI